MKFVASAFRWCTALVVGCFLASVSAHAQAVITHRVTIRAILVNHTTDASKNGNISQLNNFITAADKIWSQAGIDVDLLETRTITSTKYNNLTTTLGSATSIDALDSDYDVNGISVAEASASLKVVNVWFVATIGGGSVGGVALENSTAGSRENGVAIANSASSGPALGALAHELGHVLGLSHASALGDTSNLMEGSSAIHTSTLGNIFPDGLGKYEITAAQKTTVFSRETGGEAPNYFLTAVPEPEETTAAVGGILAIAFLIRRKLLARQQTAA